MADKNAQITGMNMTNFFNRELFVYSLGDISFKKPISLMKLIYIIAMFLIYTLPMIFIVGIYFNVGYFALLIIPPIVVGHYATKPIFSGKTLPDFLFTIIKFLGEPKFWMDLKKADSFGNDHYYTNQEIWVGRRRELQILADLKEERKAKKKRG